MEESNERFYVERFRVPKEKEASCFITVNQVTGILNQDSNLHFTDQEVMKSMTKLGFTLMVHCSKTLEELGFFVVPLMQVADRLHLRCMVPI